MIEEEYIDAAETALAEYEAMCVVCDSLEKELDGERKGKSDCESQLADCKSKLEAATKELEEMKSEMAECEKECAELEAKVDTLEIENKGLSERLADERMARIAAESSAGISKNIGAMADAIKECMVKESSPDKKEMKFKVMRDGANNMVGVVAESA